MDRRTVIAIVISAVILVAGMTIQQALSKPAQKKPEDNKTAISTLPTPISATESTAPTVSPLTVGSLEQGLSKNKGNPQFGDPTQPADSIIAVTDSSIDETPIVYQNDFIRVVIDPKGAGISSLKLVKYIDDKEPVEMIMPGKDMGLQTRFGGISAAVMGVQFKRKFNSDPNVFEYYRDFFINNDPKTTFRVTKKYTFFPGDYLFKLDITLENSVNANVPVNINGLAYSLSLGPQIGPLTSRLQQNQDYRRFVYLSTNGRQVPNVSPTAEFQVKDHPSWIAIDGKYFSFFIIPGATEYQISLTAEPRDGHQGSQVSLGRPALTNSKNTDTFRIYAGPKLSNILATYNKESDNAAQQSNLNMNAIVDSDWLWWLEEALKWVMHLFYLIIPNWGIAIILLTILLKTALYPLTKKSMESSARMALLGPKINELREKYKENPKKLNEEMAKVYKTEKINPLGGCLPMLLQFPFFFAMYALFNNQFDLRGALFIPGWINDLSLPESVLNFGSFTLPFLGWNDLRLLPFLYLGSQLISGKISQMTSPAASNTQMKVMMYGLPLVFFFILYQTPSGLLVYWISQNLLQIVQQQFVNKHLERNNLRQKPAAGAKSANVISPRGGKGAQNAKVIRKSK